MSWGGSVSMMIKTLRSNGALLRGKKTFTILKEEIQRNKDQKLLKGKRLKIEPLSDELRSKIRKAAAKRKRKDRIVAVTIITILVILGVSLYNSFAPTKEQRNYAKEAEIYWGKVDDFNFYMNDGNEWLKKKNYHNAAFQFELASKAGVNYSEAQLGLTKSILGKCVEDKEECGKAEAQFNFFIKHYGKSQWMCRGLSSFLLELGDEERLNKLREINGVIVESNDE